MIYIIILKEGERTGARDSVKFPSRIVSAAVHSYRYSSCHQQYFYQQQPKAGELLTIQRGTESLLAPQFSIITDLFKLLEMGFMAL